MPLERPTPLAIAVILLALAGPLAAPDVRSDAGHDHGAAATNTASPGLPRFAATSDLFELVGVVDGTRITLYLDRSADNSPVKGATLELELGGTKLDAKPRADGEFEATLPQPLKPGLTPVTATVVAGQETDLLAGELAIAEAARTEAAPARRWQPIAGWTAAGLLAFAALAWLGRRLSNQRAARSGGAA
jgi:hypothetical protein